MILCRPLWGIFITLYNKFFKCFYKTYHQGLSRYYFNEFCDLVSWESQTDYFFDGHSNHGQYSHILKHQAIAHENYNEGVYEGVNPGHEDLGKIYTSEHAKKPGYQNF